MIKDLGAVREPRGLSWQNWTMSCKDVVVTHPRAFIISALLILAAVGGGLHHKQIDQTLAHHLHAPSSSGRQLNLNTNNRHATVARQQNTSVAQPGVSTPAAEPTTPVNTSSQTARTTTPAAPVPIICDTTKETTAKLAYNTKLTTENSYHTSQLTLLGVSGTLSTLTGGTDSKLAAENQRHDTVLQGLKQTLSSALIAADCR